jgi:hypothetical protein
MTRYDDDNEDFDQASTHNIVNVTSAMSARNSSYEDAMAEERARVDVLAHEEMREDEEVRRGGGVVFANQ